MIKMAKGTPSDFTEIQNFWDTKNLRFFSVYEKSGKKKLSDTFAQQSITKE